MPTVANGNRSREVLLQTIQAASQNGSVSFSPDDVMWDALKGLNAGSDDDLKRAVLGHFNDLLRSGAVGLGDPKALLTGLTPQGNPWPHKAAYLTPEGKKTVEHASRDPINLPGYLAYLDQESPLDAVTRGYVEEALNTYRACCYKATAILIGAAVENLVLTLRDTLLAQLNARKEKLPKGLEAWQVKTALEAVADRILPDLRGDAKKTGDESLRNLAEQADARLHPVAAEFRKTRNDAGHPASLTPVKPADVHCNLLLFPSTAKLLQELNRWVTAYYN